MQIRLEVRFYSIDGDMEWDSKYVEPGEYFSIPPGAITADIIPHGIDDSIADIPTKEAIDFGLGNYIPPR
jgi:hypothetical protein